MPHSETTRAWSKGKLLKFSLFSIVLFLLAAEGISRIIFYFKFRGLHTSVYIQGSPLQEEDTNTVYNNRAYYVDYEKRFQYNEKGMRSLCGDFRLPARKGKNDLWIMLMGGSAMEGMGSNKEGDWYDITNIPDHPYAENIAFYLQSILQKKYPSRSVRVFNAAVSGFTIDQGFLKYQSLSTGYDFDWVISMDGVNECDTLNSDREEDEKAYDRKYWESFPFQAFPMRWIVPVTQHSALFSLLKQEIYYLRLNARTKRNEREGFPKRKFWADHPTRPLLFAESDQRVDNSVRSFIKEMKRWAGHLNGRNYLFLVQPYLAFRDSSKMSVEERALGNYLRAADNDEYKQAFFKKVYDSVERISQKDLHFQNMSAVQSWPGWNFVDYCHFTAAANQRIADELANFIGADGKIRIFRE